MQSLNRRDFLRTCSTAAAGMAVSCSSGPWARRQTKPNFVFILIDDLGWRDVGFMGSTFYETPNIDRLASQGVVFTDAYANAPNCAPTRACLLTGQYTPRHGIYTVGTSERGQARQRRLIPIPNRTTLPDESITLAEALRPAGYVSASIGKWHLGRHPVHGPTSQGFDVNIGGDANGSPRSGHFAPHKTPNLEDAPEGEYLTDRLTDEACRFMEQNRERPFLLYLSHYAVHYPIQAPQELVEKYREKNRKEKGERPKGGTSDELRNSTYAAMIESMDQSVGRVMDTLHRLVLAENTVVVFFSDNGGHANVTSMEPLRGSKGTAFEGGVRVPLIVRWPGRAQAGQRCDTPVIGVDFFPTFLDMAGVSQPPDWTLDGESIVPLLKGAARLEREAIFWHFPAYLEAYNRQQGAWRCTPWGAVRKGDYKLIEYFETGRVELFNLAEDVGERIDLAGHLPEKRDELHAALRAWRKKVGAPVPTEPNPEYSPKPDMAPGM